FDSAVFVIEIRDLHKSFGQQNVLSGVNLTIKTGTTVAVVGPSGTGKSVLLKIITGLLPASGGEVLVDGESMTHAESDDVRREICAKMGVLFQSAALFDSLNLLDNVAFPLFSRGKKPRDECYETAFEYLEEVGLADYAYSNPGEVSIGMRKRAGVARALITE